MTTRKGLSGLLALGLTGTMVLASVSQAAIAPPLQPHQGNEPPVDKAAGKSPVLEAVFQQTLKQGGINPNLVLPATQTAALLQKPKAPKKEYKSIIKSEKPLFADEETELSQLTEAANGELKLNDGVSVTGKTKKVAKAAPTTRRATPITRQNRLVAYKPEPTSFYLKALPSLSNTAIPMAEKQGSIADLKQLSTGINETRRQLELIQGKGHVLTLDGPIKRVAISNPNVASALVVSTAQVQLIGQNPGVATLTLWPQGSGTSYVQYDITVRRDVSILEKQISQIAPNVSVTPLVAQDTVILRGEVETLEESQLVLQLARAFFTTSAPVAGMSTPGAGGGGGAAGAGGGAGAGGAAPGGGAAAGGAGAGQAGGGGQGANMPNLASSVPGSAIIGSDGSIINLMHVKGMPSTKLELVRQKLKALNENIVLDVVPGNAGTEKAILSGKVPSTGFIAKAINIASLFYGEPGLRVLNGPAGNAVRNQGTEDFQTAEAFSDNMDVNLLQGMVVTDNSGNVVSLLEVNKRPQVRCRVKILDVSRNATDVLGVPFVQYLGGTVQLGADLTPPGAPAANAAGLRNLKGVSGSIVGANSLNVTLQALQEKQIVNSLAEPTLTMLSGEKASFLAGGEIPIPISDANGRITLEYREFGVRLNIIATVTDENKIHLQVAPEVSSIDPALAFNSQLISIPGIRSRRIQTTVEMLPGQNFVLGGLFSSEDTRSFSQFPGLGNIPILGNFFRTNLNDGTDSELVVLIQPEIITAEEVATAK